MGEIVDKVKEKATDVKDKDVDNTKYIIDGAKDSVSTTSPPPPPPPTTPPPPPPPPQNPLPQISTLIDPKTKNKKNKKKTSQNQITEKILLQIKKIKKKKQ